MVAVASLAAAAPAVAAPSFTPPQTLPATAPVTESQVALDRRGDAFAIWRQVTTNGLALMASTRTEGGQWSPAQQLSESDIVLSASLAVDGGGDAVVVWAGLTSSDDVVYSSIRPFGGSWSSPDTVSDPSDDSIFPQVVIDTDGNATAVWSSNITSATLASARSLRGTWSPPVALSPDGDSTSGVDVAVDANGTATAAWLDDTGDTTDVMVATRPVGADWTAPTDMQSPDGSDAGQVVVGAGGPTSVVSWMGFGTTVGTVFASTSVSGGAWTPPHQLSDPSTDCDEVTIAVDGSGRALAAWHAVDYSTPDAVDVARYTAGGWGPPQRLTDASDAAPDAEFPAIAAPPPGGRGGWMVLWLDDEPTSALVGESSPDGLTWTTPLAVSDPTQDSRSPTTSEDVQGDVLAGWTLVGSPGNAPQVSTFDATGPDLRNLDVPTTARVGQPVALSVQPVDDWSTLLSPASWTFGDGSGTVANATSHVYQHVGTYTVTVTAADAIGNLSNANRRLDVTVTGGGGGGPANGTPPQLTGLRAVPRRFVGGHGTMLRFRLSSPATLRVAIRRARARKAVDGFVAVRAGGAGSLRLRGRFHGHALRPGLYVVSVRPAHGDLRGSRRSILVTVLAPRRAH